MQAMIKKLKSYLVNLVLIFLGILLGYILFSVIALIDFFMFRRQEFETKWRILFDAGFFWSECSDLTSNTINNLLQDSDPKKRLKGAKCAFYYDDSHPGEIGGLIPVANHTMEISKQLEIPEAFLLSGVLYMTGVGREEVDFRKAYPDILRAKALGYAESEPWIRTLNDLGYSIVNSEVKVSP
jgi:hypothetical protein